MLSSKRSFSLLFICLLICVIAATVKLPSVYGWGLHGHWLSGRAAGMKIPAEMPKFFRKSVDQFAYLNPDPDRWRDRQEADIDKAFGIGASFDHYIDLEFVPLGALKLPTRYDFIAELVKANRKPSEAGFAPFRSLEMFQSLRVQFKLWRAEKDGTRRRYIEERIINDAGILGHYITDLANPHHTTMHHNGWVGDNPKGYTTYSRERGFHARFEEEFVQARVKLDDVLPLISATPRVFTSPRDEIIAHTERSHAKLEELYILDKREQFSATNNSADHKKFAVERLAAGAEMLRDLWWTAWITSAPTAPAAAAKTN
jgi:hypothetical protein